MLAYYIDGNDLTASMGPITVFKFSSEDCGTCHRMSHYDEAVSKELGYGFVNVMLQDTDVYKRQLLFHFVYIYASVLYRW